MVAALAAGLLVGPATSPASAGFPNITGCFYQSWTVSGGYKAGWKAVKNVAYNDLYLIVEGGFQSYLIHLSRGEVYYSDNPNVYFRCG